MAKKQIYEFTLVLSGVDDQTLDLEDQLFGVGCDDALVNYRGSTVYIDFSREHISIDKAVISAIHAVESIDAKPKVISILPDDMVTESEIAKRLGKRRQAVSLWVKGSRRGKNPFPKPISKLSDKSPMWRWFDVIQWLYTQKIVEDRKLLVIAKFMSHINAVLEERDPKTHRDRHKILDQLQQVQT